MPHHLVRFNSLAAAISAMSGFDLDLHFGLSKPNVLLIQQSFFFHLFVNVVGENRNISSATSAVEEIETILPISIPAFTKPKTATTLLAV